MTDEEYQKLFQIGTTPEMLGIKTSVGKQDLREDKQMQMSAEMATLLFSTMRHDEYIARMWPHYNDAMREFVLLMRHQNIAKLQKLQLKEFDYGR